MNLLRKSYLWILLIGAVGFWFYSDFTRKATCEKPIAYTVGAFDSRFNISKPEFVSAIKQAENIWENAVGKNLFEYDPKPASKNRFYLYIGKYFVREAVPVNLVYDDRQKTADTRRGLISQVNETKESAEAVKREFTALQNKYKQVSAEYQTMLAQYKRREINFNTLEAKRQEVNNLADETNAMVKKYNSIVGEVNATVRTVNQYAGQEFEEGEYIYDNDGERINIYEFGTDNTLIRVLAHELGHAIGLDHNENVNSIMYYLNTSTSMTPTKDDLAALSLICKGK